VGKTFVGSRVRQLRSERGFSQAALAQMLDISPSYLNQIEHDVRPLTVAVLLRITEVPFPQRRGGVTALLIVGAMMLAGSSAFAIVVFLRDVAAPATT